MPPSPPALRDAQSPESDAADPTALATGGARVLYLAGTWSRPGDSFALRATLSVSPVGATSGPIWWAAHRAPGVEGIEQVRGTVDGSSLEISGFETGPGLACDHYRITLLGDDRSGSFSGTSRAFGQWDGRLQGGYWFAHDSGLTAR